MKPSTLSRFEPKGMEMPSGHWTHHETMTIKTGQDEARQGRFVMLEPSKISTSAIFNVDNAKF